MSFGLDDPNDEFLMETSENLEKHRDLIRFLFMQLFNLLVRRRPPNMNDVRARMIELEFDPDELVINKENTTIN